MKNAEFIELLNLYLDHEISPAEAERLESEVLNNPERRRIYQQYCQMQKACKVLAADFHSEPAVGAGSLGKKVMELEAAGGDRRQLRGYFYAAGAVAAAAACVALIFSGRRMSDALDGTGPAPDQVAIQVPASPSSTLATSSVATGAAGGSTTGVGIVQRPMLVSDPLLLGGTSRTAEYVSTASPANDELAWIRTLQLTPVPSRVLVEDLHFDAQPATLRPEPRALGGYNGQAEAPSEMTAFRFVK